MHDNDSDIKKISAELNGFFDNNGNDGLTSVELANITSGIEGKKNASFNASNDDNIIADTNVSSFDAEKQDFFSPYDSPNFHIEENCTISDFSLKAMDALAEQVQNPNSDAPKVIVQNIVLEDSDTAITFDTLIAMTDYFVSIGHKTLAKKVKDDYQTQCLRTCQDLANHVFNKKMKSIERVTRKCRVEGEQAFPKSVYPKIFADAGITNPQIVDDDGYYWNWHYTPADALKFVKFVDEKILPLLKDREYKPVSTDEKFNSTSSKVISKSLNYGAEILTPNVTEDELAEINKLSAAEKFQLELKINRIDLRKIFQLDKQQNGIICPKCGNGGGYSGDGVVPTLTATADESGNEYYLHHCFKCGKFEGRLTDIIAKLHESKHNDAKTLAIGKKILDLVESSTYTPPIIERRELTTAENEKLLALIRADIEESQKHLDELPLEDRRGLTLETLKKFGVGYLSNWVNPKLIVQDAKTYPSERIIVPTSELEHYLAAIPLSKRTEKNKKYSKQHAGQKCIFNISAIVPNATIIVTEGEFDAMSIWQCTEGKVPVIATCATTSFNLVTEYIRKNIVSSERANYSFVVLFDNDDSGKEKSAEFTEELKRLGCLAVRNFLVDGTEKLDANDFLIQFGNADLKARIESILTSAQIEFDTSRADLQHQLEKACDFAADDDCTTRAIFKDCPVDLVIPFGFIVTKNGIFCTSKNGAKKLVSYTPIVISRKYYYPKDKTYKFLVSYRNDKDKWIDCPMLFEGKQLIDSHKLLALADFNISVDSGQANFLAAYFNGLLHAKNNSSRIPVTTIYRQTGWLNDDFSKFAYPPDGEDYRLCRENIPYSEIFKPKGNADLWLKTFEKVVDDGDAIARLVIGSALAAPLCKVLDNLNIWLHLQGKRSNGKTALLKFAISIFCNPQLGIRTFDATPKNLLEMTMAFCDLPLGIDELETLKARTTEEQLGTMVYNFSSGSGNQANLRDGTSRQMEKFHGTRISTGEHALLPPNAKGGAFKRVLQITTNKIFDEFFSTDIHRISQQNFGHYGRRWIEFIIANKNFISEEFEKIAVEVQKFGVQFGTLQFKFNVDATHIKATVLCLIAYEYFEIMLGLSSSLNYERLNYDLKEILECLPTADDLDESTRAISFLSSFIVGHPKNFWYESTNEDAVGQANELYGKIFADGSVAFLTNALKKILEVDGGFSSYQKILCELADKKLLIAKKDYRHRLTINQKFVWTYHFKPNILVAYDKTEDNENFSAADS